jgi:hypothetical protein
VWVELLRLRAAGWGIVLASTVGACTSLRATAPETGTGGAGNAAGAAGTGGDGEAGTSGDAGSGGSGGSGGAATAGTTGNGGGAGTTAVVEPPDLMAFWRFNEGTGATVVDNSGNGQTLLISTSARWTNTGHEGAAFGFDGASDVAGIMPIVGQKLYDFPTVPLTISAWVRPDATASSRAFASIIARSHEDYAFQDFWLGLVNGRPRCTIHSPSQQGPTATAVVPANTWTHVACKYGLDGVVTLFVNGGYATSETTTQLLGPIPTAILVGASETMQPAVRDQFFPGAIDDVRIYNRQLTDAEVRSLVR